MGIINPLNQKEEYFMAIKTYHLNVCKQISWPLIWQPFNGNEKYGH